ncbi:hypothetical protein FHQ18_00580 [Deferribacter autotrophicus]|uniref:Dynamin N-terminal domain-containing protein n=1 Tax=Deferribacter autotrophicus TaxID=500465 RepID=A0A5A8F5S9_9BACT|nr:dynamin family protein [Deferribacter autotrophicus]KAA0259407.1 hypothetical protein FHQ18_00580 [Deferribacter autotrophicus]
MSLRKLREIINKYNDYPWYNELKLFDDKYKIQDLEEEINVFKPKIAVIGEFSSGKSTLINSFLAEDLLPAKYQPTTVFITEIKYSSDNYLLVDGERRELTKENLENIDNIKSDKIEVFLNNPILQEYTFVDTPGTNDPSKFTDEIVFNLVGESDVVIFVMNINQALKETERQFISKLIRKKDLEKFFFVLNFADIVDNPRLVKNEVIDKLNTLLKLNKDTLKTHTFLYSAKEVLKNRLNGIKSESYEIFIENIDEFIKSHKQVLLNEWLENETRRIIESIILKIEAIEDKINGKAKKYEEELAKINEEMKNFELAINKELINFEREFNIIKENYKRRIKDSIKYVYSEISNEVNNMSYEQLAGTRYIELRTKKLLEDKIEQDTKLFLKDVSKLITDFDEKVLSLKDTGVNFIFTTPKKAGAGKKIVNLTALTAGGVGVASLLPTMATGVGIASGIEGLSAIAPFLAGIPIVGPVLAGIGSVGAIALPVIGSFALAAGKVLFDVAKWGVGKIGDVATVVEEKAKRRIFLNQVKKELDKIESQMISQIEKLNIEEFKENYIKSKFPQKVILEEKIKLIKSKQFETLKLAEEELVSLNNFKSELMFY